MPVTGTNASSWAISTGICRARFLAMATHSDVDHSGGLNALARAAHCKIAVFEKSDQGFSIDNLADAGTKLVTSIQEMLRPRASGGCTLRENAKSGNGTSSFRNRATVDACGPIAREARL